MWRVFILTQEKKFRLQNKMDELKDKGKKVIENIGEKKSDLIQKWEDKSRDFIDTFLLLFGRDGRLVWKDNIFYDTLNWRPWLENNLSICWLYGHRRTFGTKAKVGWDKPYHLRRVLVASLAPRRLISGDNSASLLLSVC